MTAGRFINNPFLVNKLSQKANNLIEDLEFLGLKFAKSKAGTYLQRHLGGSSYPRSVYNHGIFLKKKIKYLKKE